MSRLGTLAILAGSLLLAPVYGQGQSKSLLKWKFETNKPFFQKMTTETKQNMSVSDNKVEQNQVQTFYFSWTPLKNEGDNWELRQRIEGIVMSIDIGGNKISYDSTKDTGESANPLSEFFKALKGSEFVVTYNTKENKVTKITGREDFIKKMVASNPQMQSLLDKILNEQALKDMSEPTFGSIPGWEASTGDKKTGEWTRESIFDLGPIGKYKNTYKYTYQGKDKTNAKLDNIKVDLNMLYQAGESTAGGLPFKITSADIKTTKAGGEILFNAEKGRIEKSATNLSLNGSLTIEIGGQSTKVNLEQSQNTTVDTMDSNPLAPAGAPAIPPVPGATTPPMTTTPPAPTTPPAKPEEKKEEPKKEEAKKEAPKKEEPKKDEGKKDEGKKKM